jgi:hypothetical protein
MNAVFTPETAAQIKPQSTYAHYDVLDTVENINHPLLKAMVLGSVEWAINMQCINAARGAFYTARALAVDDAVQSDIAIDELNDFVNTIAELKANEQYNTDLGFEQNAGDMQQLALLLPMRQKWYDVADTAHGAAKMVFKSKTFEELLASEKVRTVDVESACKISDMTTMLCKGDAEKAKRVTDMLLAQQQSKLAQSHQTNKLIAPAVLSIIRMAEYRNEESPEFWQLSIETQRRLILSTKNAVERTMTTLATWRSVSQHEYAKGVLLDGFAAVDELEAVLAAPKFTEQ